MAETELPQGIHVAQEIAPLAGALRAEDDRFTPLYERLINLLPEEELSLPPSVQRELSDLERNPKRRMQAEEGVRSRYFEDPDAFLSDLDSPKTPQQIAATIHGLRQMYVFNTRDTSLLGRIKPTDTDFARTDMMEEVRRTLEESLASSMANVAGGGENMPSYMDPAFEINLLQTATGRVYEEFAGLERQLLSHEERVHLIKETTIWFLTHQVTQRWIPNLWNEGNAEWTVATAVPKMVEGYRKIQRILPMLNETIKGNVEEIGELGKQMPDGVEWESLLHAFNVEFRVILEGGVERNIKYGAAEMWDYFLGNHYEAQALEDMELSFIKELFSKYNDLFKKRYGDDFNPLRTFAKYKRITDTRRDLPFIRKDVPKDKSLSQWKIRRSEQLDPIEAQFIREIVNREVYVSKEEAYRLHQNGVEKTANPGEPILDWFLHPDDHQKFNDDVTALPIFPEYANPFKSGMVVPGQELFTQTLSDTADHGTRQFMDYLFKKHKIDPNEVVAVDFPRYRDGRPRHMMVKMPGRRPGAVSKYELGTLSNLGPARKGEGVYAIQYEIIFDQYQIPVVNQRGEPLLQAKEGLVDLSEIFRMKLDNNDQPLLNDKKNNYIFENPDGVFRKVINPATGLEVLEPVTRLPQYELQLNQATGKPIPETEKTLNGRGLISDKDGRPKYLQLTDRYGELLYDEKGNPVYGPEKKYRQHTGNMRDQYGRPFYEPRHNEDGIPQYEPVRDDEGKVQTVTPQHIMVKNVMSPRLGLMFEAFLGMHHMTGSVELDSTWMGQHVPKGIRKSMTVKEYSDLFNIMPPYAHDFLSRDMGDVRFRKKSNNLMVASGSSSASSHVVRMRNPLRLKDDESFRLQPYSLHPKEPLDLATRREIINSTKIEDRTNADEQLIQAQVEAGNWVRPYKDGRIYSTREFQQTIIDGSLIARYHEATNFSTSYRQLNHLKLTSEAAWKKAVSDHLGANVTIESERQNIIQALSSTHDITLLNRNETSLTKTQLQEKAQLLQEITDRLNQRFAPVEAQVASELNKLAEKYQGEQISKRGTLSKAAGRLRTRAESIPEVKGWSKEHARAMSTFNATDNLASLGVDVEAMPEFSTRGRLGYLKWLQQNSVKLDDFGDIRDFLNQHWEYMGKLGSGKQGVEMPLIVSMVKSSDHKLLAAFGAVPRRFNEFREMMFAAQEAMAHGLSQDEISEFLNGLIEGFQGLASYPSWMTNNQLRHMLKSKVIFALDLIYPTNRSIHFKLYDEQGGLIPHYISDDKGKTDVDPGVPGNSRKKVELDLNIDGSSIGPHRVLERVVQEKGVGRVVYSADKNKRPILTTPGLEPIIEIYASVDSQNNLILPESSPVNVFSPMGHEYPEFTLSTELMQKIVGRKDLEPKEALAELITNGIMDKLKLTYTEQATIKELSH